MSNSNPSCCAQGRADYPSVATGTVATTCGGRTKPNRHPSPLEPSKRRHFPDGIGRPSVSGPGGHRQRVCHCVLCSQQPAVRRFRPRHRTTDAERYGWSFVFAGLLPYPLKREISSRVPDTPWWIPVPHAYWAQPEGPPSTILDRLNHPVAHASWNDASAYCQWSGTRLPTEAEWEMAARGGIKQAIYPWGDELTPAGKHCCNIWQGDFPDHNTAADGYAGTAPVHAFSANGYDSTMPSATSGNGARIISHPGITA